jgi:hypothetical protein
VEIDSSVKNIRPYTACAIIKNIKFNDEKILSISGTDLTYYTVIGDQLFDGDTLIAEATPL